MFRCLYECVCNSNQILIRHHYHGYNANVLDYIHLYRPSDRCAGCLIHPAAVLICHHYHGDNANVLNYIHLSRPSDRCVGCMIHPSAVLIRYHCHGDKANVLNYIHLFTPSDRCVGWMIHPTAILPISYFTVDFGVVTDRQNWILRRNSDSSRFAPTVGGGDGVGRCSATFQWVRRIHTVSPVSRRPDRGNYTWSLRLSRSWYLW